MKRLLMKTKSTDTDAITLDTLRGRLSRAQNPDGGWGYGAGHLSWTEPTAYALLALMPADDSVVRRGVRWLLSIQRRDGGWPPAASVDQSTWVTAVAMLALARAGRLPDGSPAIHWLLDQTGKESKWLVRVRQSLLGVRPDQVSGDLGWPWFPGAAAWVTPTAMSILALRYLHRRGNTSAQDRILEGERFLLSRMCSDGGWNHGSARALGYEAASYPETTGVALLALAGSRLHELSRSVACASKHLAECRSSHGSSWLQLALLAHGQKPGDFGRQATTGIAPPRSLPDIAIAILAERALEGTHVLVQ